MDRALTYRFAPLINLVSSIFCQALGIGAAMVSAKLGLPVWFITGLQGVCAFLIARFLKLPWAWQIANLLIAPAVVVYSLYNLPAYIPLIIVLLIALIHLPTFWTGVPYYPTSLAAYTQISSLLPQDREFKFIDLGCGFGPLLGYLAKDHPAGRFVGSEISVLPYCIAKLRSFGQSGITITMTSFWEIDLNQYDFVYAFLAPGPMEALWKKVKKEMRPGSTFITNTFKVADTADKAIEVGDKRGCVLYVHKIQ